MYLIKTNDLLLVSILSQTIPIHIFTHDFLTINCNIIFKYTPMSTNKYVSFRYPNQKYTHIYQRFDTCYMLIQSRYPWFHRPNNIYWRVHIIKFIVTQFPSSCLLGTNIFLSVCSQTMFFPLDDGTIFTHVKIR